MKKHSAFGKTDNVGKAHLLNTSIGEYRLVDFLGAGGMGQVYRGVHSKIGRVAAVKVLTQTSLGGAFVERFFNEARIQASLQHPNIATLYDFLEFDGQPCIIMEYVDGETLTERIKRHSSLSQRDSLSIFQAVVEAIMYIHGHGIIHRDIKSNNIKISTAGKVKLLDFGIAKGQTSPGLTTDGNVIGTLEYLSPEQLKGGYADVRSDIWALGMLLYEMVTGVVPFHSTTAGDLCEKIDKVIYVPPRDLKPSVPRELSNIIARCLKRSPADRFQSAEELLQQVSHLRAQLKQRESMPQLSSVSGGNPSPVSAELTGPSWFRRNWIMVAAVSSTAAVFLVFALSLGIYLLVRQDSAEDNNANTPARQQFASNPGQQQSNVATLVSTNDVTARTIEIHMTEGQADVYREGLKLGTTPFQLTAKKGERVNLVLKREGYSDRPVDIDVSDNRKVYTYTMLAK